MSDVGYDGVLDVPDDPLPQTARCPLCLVALRPEDDPDCGDEGCPAAANADTIRELRRP